MKKTITLLGDIGGTNARFAIVATGDNAYSNFKKLRCDDFKTLIDAIICYLKDIEVENIESICLAIAAPIYEKKIKIVNNHWFVDEDELYKVFNVSSINIINDFAAIAHAIDSIDKSHYLDLGSQEPINIKKLQYNIGIVGPGTGLGSSGLRKLSNRPITYFAELGHVGFAPQNELQIELVKVLKTKYDRVVNETFVSGPGLKNIFWALHEIKSKYYSEYSSEEIFNQINNNNLAKQSTEIFFEMLGQVAGDFALAIGAFDGVLIAGDLVNNHAKLIKESQFRFGFENKDSYRGLMQKIPTSLIDVSEVGLLGIYEFHKAKKVECN